MVVGGLGSGVWIIGRRYAHHARNSGYEGFNRILRLPIVGVPAQNRFSSSIWGWRLDRAVARLARRPFYSARLFLNEVAVAAHMMTRRGALYHAIYGDTDIHILGKVASATGNRLAVSYHEPPENLEYMDVSKELVSTFSAVILICETQRPFFEAMMPSSRIYVVPHSIDTAFFNPSYPLTREPVCITVGNHLRDFVMLERAMMRVWSQVPEVRLIAIGTRRTKDKANPQMRLNDPRVEYLDGIDDRALLMAYHRARLALLPLKAATANNALLEALACGLPLISTNCGGIQEYIGQNAGMIVPPNDPDQFASAILELIPARSPAHFMGANARKRALRFDNAVVGHQMKLVYEKILNARQDSRVSVSN